MTDTIEEKHVLSIADATGDTRIMWNPNNKDEVSTARAAFDEAKKKGMVAYAVDPDSADKGEVIRKFDPEAGKIIMSRQLQGG